MRAGTAAVDPISAGAAAIVTAVAIAYPLSMLLLAALGLWWIAKRVGTQDEGTA